MLIESQEPQYDEDGYAIGDPYAEPAKMVDKAKENRTAMQKLPGQVSKAIWDN